jgi:hypothetical protein
VWSYNSLYCVRNVKAAIIIKITKFAIEEAKKAHRESSYIAI